MRELLLGLEALGSFDVKQLQDIVIYSLDRFDLDGDRRISPEEFVAALTALGFKLPAVTVTSIFTLLDTDGDGYIGTSSAQSWGATSDLERIGTAFEGAMRTQFKRKGLDKVAEQLQSAMKNDEEVQIWEQMGLMMQSMAQFDKKSEVLQDFFDMGLNAGAFGTALLSLYNEVSGLQSWADLDLMNVAPFLIFMGMSGVHMARELSRHERKDLTEDEALLYAQVFQRHGFSVAEFYQLLRGGGATWEDVQDQRMVDTATTKHLSFVVRGGASMYDSHSPVGNCEKNSQVSAHSLGFGSAIGEAAFLQDERPTGGEFVVVEAGARLVNWDVDRLRRHLVLNEAAAGKLRTLLVETRAAEVLAAAQRTPKEASTGSRGGQSLRPHHLRRGLVSVARKLGAGDVAGARADLDATVEEYLSASPDAVAGQLLAWTRTLGQKASCGGGNGT